MCVTICPQVTIRLSILSFARLSITDTALPSCDVLATRRRPSGHDSLPSSLFIVPLRVFSKIISRRDETRRVVGASISSLFCLGKNNGAILFANIVAMGLRRRGWRVMSSSERFSGKFARIVRLYAALSLTDALPFSSPILLSDAFKADRHMAQSAPLARRST